MFSSSLHCKLQEKLPRVTTPLQGNQARGLVSKETVVLRQWGRETELWIYQLS